MATLLSETKFIEDNNVAERQCVLNMPINEMRSEN